MNKEILKTWMAATDARVEGLEKMNEHEFKLIRIQEEQIKMLQKTNKLLNERIDLLSDAVKTLKDVVIGELEDDED